MLLKLDHMIDYQNSKTFKFNVNDHKSVIIDTYPNGDIEAIWLFDYNRPADDRIVAWGSYDARKMFSNITEVMNLTTEELNTDSLVRIADQFILEN